MVPDAKHNVVPISELPCVLCGPAVLCMHAFACFAARLNLASTDVCAACLPG